jgi:hypothetical protein
MSKADQFRRYAEEAMRWAFKSKNSKRDTSPDRACVHMDASGGKQPAAVTLKQKPRSRGLRVSNQVMGSSKTPDYSDGGWVALARSSVMCSVGELFYTDSRHQICQASRLRGRCHGGWQCHRLAISGNMPRKENRRAIAPGSSHRLCTQASITSLICPPAFPTAVLKR